MTTNTTTNVNEIPPRSSFQESVSTFYRNKGAVLGLIVLTSMVVLAFLAPYIAPHDPFELYTGKEQLPPMFIDGGEAQFLLGTDDAGRDTLSRILYGARYSLFIGLTATSLAMMWGLCLGLSAAYWPKVWGKCVMLVNDILMSYPGLLLAIIIAAILGPNMTNTIITIALVCTPPFIRLTRATAMVELKKEYFISSKIMGAGTARLLFLTILPNCMAPIIVQATMIFSNAILEAGAIGFLGFGVQPPNAEWGAMLGTARQYIQSNVWLAIWPGLAIFLAALSINMTGDGLRDALDPKLKQLN